MNGLKRVALEVFNELTNLLRHHFVLFVDPVTVGSSRDMAELGYQQAAETLMLDRNCFKTLLCNLYSFQFF